MRKLTLLFLIFFSIASIAQNQKAKNNSELSKTDIDTEIIDEQPPMHPSCTDKNTKGEIERCMNIMIAKHIQHKFRFNNVTCVKKELVKNSETGEEEEVCTETLERGYHRIYIQFVVDKKGDITNIKVINKSGDFITEVKRVMSLLPRMKPGMQRGKPVNVRYVLPLQLKY
jgi:protein TonB